MHHTDCGMETFNNKIMSDLLASSLKTANIDGKTMPVESVAERSIVYLHQQAVMRENHNGPPSLTNIN